MSELPINQVVCGAFPAATRGWPDEKINLVMFSPPYWGLRNYGENVNAVWGGDSGCEHEWGKEIARNVAPRRQLPHGDGRSTKTDKYVMERVNVPEPQPTQQGCFCQKCGAWYGQLGLEPTYQMYVAHMVDVGREVKRILRKDGSWYLNLGDTYNSVSGHSGEFNQSWKRPSREQAKSMKGIVSNIPAKCKLLIPHRVALALIDDGWICRNDITWYKPNAMPSSTKDRLTCQTECVFHFVKSRKYYYDLDAIREPHKSSSLKRAGKIGVVPFNLRVRDVTRGKFGTTAQEGKLRASKEEVEGYQYPEKLTKHDIAVDRVGNFSYTDPLHTKEYHPTGKNPGDVLTSRQENIVGHFREKGSGGHYEYGGLESPEGVHYAEGGRNPGDFWGITTKPSNDYWCPNCKDFVKQKEMKCVRCGMKVMAHFAVYPEELCIKPIKSSCPTQVCRKCGKPREQIIETHNPSKSYQDGKNLDWTNVVGQKTSNPQSSKSLHRNKGGVYYSGKTVGFTDCGCGAGFEPGIVVDPMCGRGTTLVAAKKLGLRFIGIDINPDYCEMTTKWLSRVEWPLEAYA